jgi:hypothetical protein
VPFARLDPLGTAHRDLLLVAVTERVPRAGLDGLLAVLRSF